MTPTPSTDLLQTSVRASVHREPVTAVDDRVVGYTISVSLADAELDERVLNEVLHEQYLMLDLESLVADRDVFLPATTAMLAGFVPTPPQGSRLVLDLPLGFEYRADADRRAAALRALGIDLDLTGFAATPLQMRMLPFVSYVTIDPVALEQSLEEVVNAAHASDVTVLATGVTDARTLTRCLAAGCDAFRGGAADRAAEQTETQQKVLRPGQLQCLAALHLLHQVDVDMGEVSQVIETDPILTLRVLHLVNSGAFALRSRVDVIRQAVVLLGLREVTTLVAALAIDARPGAMDSLWQILARALTCEALSDDPAAYTVGMLSALVVELGVPADVVLDKVGVSDVVADAVRDQTGELGPVLAAVCAHERGDLNAVVTSGFLPADVSDTYLACLSDALQTAKAIDG